MRHQITMLLIALSLGMSSCTTTYMVTTKTALDKAVNDVSVEMGKYGYYAAGVVRDTKNEVTVTGQSYSKYSGYGTKMDNNYITNEVLRYADTVGNIMNITISYQLKEHDQLFYVTDLHVKGCETSNVKEYNKLCGSDSPKKIIETLPQNTPVSIYDETKTYVFSGALALLACLPLLIYSFSLSSSYTY